MANSVKCPKCNGRGTIDQYKRVNGGLCYTCNGTGRAFNKRIVKKYSTKGFTLISNKEEFTIVKIQIIEKDFLHGVSVGGIDFKNPIFIDTKKGIHLKNHNYKIIESLSKEQKEFYIKTVKQNIVSNIDLIKEWFL
jgi:RecJ-like exonuclease